MSDDTDSQKLFEPKYPIVTIEDEMRDSYLEYAMSVIVGRALPDVRDGLKPVHRRVLLPWMCSEMTITSLTKNLHELLVM